MKTTTSQTLALVLAVALAVQGVIPDAWPIDSVGWVRLVVAVVAIVAAALLRSPVLGAAPAALALLAVASSGCSHAVPVGSLVTPVSVHCDVWVTAYDGGTLSFSTQGDHSRWLDHYCGSDPSGGVDQTATPTSSPTVETPVTVSP